MKKAKGRKVQIPETETIGKLPRPQPAKRAADLKKTVKKRSRQYRHLLTALRAAIRILNAFDQKTIYRK